MTQLASVGLPGLEAGALVLARWLSRAGMCVLLGFAAATLVDGLSRSFANAPVDAVRDMGELTIAVAISSCFPLGFLERRNIVISFIESAVSLRAVQWLEILAAVSVAIILFLFAWQFAIYARELSEARERTALLEIPKAPFWFAVDINLWLTFAAQLIVVMRSIATPVTDV